MRGKVCHPHLKKPFPGITPACAGKRVSRFVFGILFQDHPRMCGEKRGPLHRPEGALWITPACAGKRGCADLTADAPRDHPRMCGEKMCQWRRSLKLGGSPPRMRGKVQGLRPCTLVTGSPPRMRGKDDPAHPVAAPAGITPAYAGKSCPFLRRTSPRRDHPRVCGEKPA